METITKERDNLIQMIHNFREQEVIELLDYAQFLKHKKKLKKTNRLSRYTNKILNEDKKLLQRLAC
jgi:hypothetical protein